MRSSSAATSSVRVRASLDSTAMSSASWSKSKVSSPERERLLRRAEQCRGLLRAPPAARVTVQETPEAAPGRAVSRCWGRRSRRRGNAAASCWRGRRGRPPATSVRAAPAARRAAPATSCAAARGSGAAASRAAAGRPVPGHARRAALRGGAAGAARADASRAGRSWCACGSSRAGPPSAPAVPARRARRAAGTRRRAAPRHCAWAPGSPAPRRLLLARAASPTAVQGLRPRCGSGVRSRRSARSRRRGWPGGRPGTRRRSPTTTACVVPSLHPAAHSIRWPPERGRRTGHSLSPNPPIEA